jgi:hypothetical protein
MPQQHTLIVLVHDRPDVVHSVVNVLLAAHDTARASVAKRATMPPPPPEPVYSYRAQADGAGEEDIAA